MSIKKFAPKFFALVLILSMVGTLIFATTPARAQTDDNAPITVWIDQDRQPAIDAYVKAFPDKGKLIKVSIVDREQFPAKVLLFNNTGQGWPDVVFAEPRLVARVADAAHQFPLDLTGQVPADVLKNFAGMDGCTFGGKVYCLRYDLAQYVLYYNKPLMDKFGYKVPATFEDYQALSDKVAKENPGYLLGTFGDGWSFLSFFDASGCPTHTLVDPNTIKINMSDPNCVRAAKLVDHMTANKTLWNTDYFDASWVKQMNDNKVLMVSMAAWGWGVFGGTKDSSYYKTAEHQLGVAAPLKWANQDKAIDPTQGGSAWTVSQHTANPKLAVDLVQWLTTSPDLWAKTTNFPAYKPLMPLWQKNVSSNPLFANDPYPIVSAAADLIGASDTWPRFDMIAPLNQVVKQAQTDKVSYESVLPKVADAFTPLAQAEGYQVVNQ